MNVRLVLVLAVLSLGAGTATAQGRPAIPPVDSALVRVRLVDGSQVVGRVVSASDSVIVLETPAGARLEFPRRALTAWTPVRGAATGATVTYDDPNLSRLFFAPTGRTLEQGDGYFADYFLLFPFVGYGIHDRVTLSGGISLLPGASSQLVYAGPKFGVVRSSGVNLAVGGSYALVPGEDEAFWTGYGALTLGGPDAALTVNGGYVGSDGPGATGGYIFLLGGEHRISTRSKLLAEIWRFEDVPETPVIGGVRFFGERIAVDFGLVYVFGVETDGWPFFPWVDFVVNW